MLSVFCFTLFSSNVCVLCSHIFDRFEQYEMLFEDVVLEGPRTSQYSPSAGDGLFLT